MTLAKISKTNEIIYDIDITGHAFYADFGNDIVCSAISMICYTIGNKLLSIEEENVNITIREGVFKIKIKKDTYENQLLMSTLEMGLQMINEQYQDNLEIREV